MGGCEGCGSEGRGSGGRIGVLEVGSGDGRKSGGNESTGRGRRRKRGRGADRASHYCCRDSGDTIDGECTAGGRGRRS